MSFIPRATFHYPLLTPSWFAGHMAKSLREMGNLLQDIDLVIEARDARLPLTSVNRAFDAVLEKSWGRRMDLDKLRAADEYGESSASGSKGGRGRMSGPNMGYNVGGKGKERLVVYTKKDLAEEQYEKVSRGLILEGTELTYRSMVAPDQSVSGTFWPKGFVHRYNFRL